MMKTEQTPNGLATYHEPTFRTYQPVQVTDEHGDTIWMTLCETLEAGRWEPFYSLGTG